MDNYFYKCEKCGYVHLVPAYWMNFSPEKELEQEHFDKSIREVCIEKQLSLLEE